MNFKPLLIAITLGVTGAITTLVTVEQRVEIDPLSLNTEPMEVLAVDCNTDTVIAQYPSVVDVEIITNIPEEEVITSIMLQQPVEGVIFRPK